MSLCAGLHPNAQLPLFVSTWKHLIQQRFFTNLQLFHDMLALGHKILDSVPFNQMHSLYNGLFLWERMAKILLSLKRKLGI